MARKKETELIDEMIEEDSEQEEINGGDVVKLGPRPGDVEWEEYVLSKLTDREKDANGHPKTAGLRRIAPGLLGKFIDSGPDTVSFPCQQNDHRAGLIYKLVYVNKYYDPEYDQPEERIITVKEVSDAWEHNIDGDDFKKHPTAIASTRAEGRALRKALLLSTVVAEEISEETYVPVNTINEGLITTTQINVIDHMCKKVNYSVEGPLKWLKVETIEEISKTKATKTVKFLNDVNNGTNEAKVPDYVTKGYDENWRK